MTSPQPSAQVKISKITLFLVATAVTLLLVYLLAAISIIHVTPLYLVPVQIAMISAAFILSFQGIFTLFWMLYGWENPTKLRADAPPRVMLPPKFRFSLLVPARFESQVIENTIQSLSRLKYPQSLLEVFILCRSDDSETIRAARQAVGRTGRGNFNVIVFDSPQTSKPSALNIGLREATGDIVGVFDAEDEPNPMILQVIDTVFQTKHPSAVQAGVQLMNYRTNWFSPLNVLEYYFWYKSALHLFSRMGVVPLGGNTVFFDRDDLAEAGGWDECLTEDAEIGLRYSLENKRIQIIYDPTLATAEESPATLAALLKQRTRWNQGFFQILLKQEWIHFSDLKRRLFAGYFLLLAQINALNFILVFFSLITLMINLPIMATLMALFPLYLLGLQLLTQLLGYYEFSKAYQQRFSILICARIVFGFLPYQLLLTFSAVRALYRHFHQRSDWEKTSHENLHRLSYV